MRRLALILSSAAVLALGGGCPGAWAQADAGPDLVKPDTAKPDPAKMELARQLLEVSGGEKRADDQVELVFNIMVKTVDDAANGLDPGLSAAFLDGLKQETVKLTPQLLELTTRLYAETCTEQELRDMLAFEKSETGQSMLRKTPIIQSQALSQTVPLMMDAMPQILQRAVDDACAKATCTSQDRRHLLGILDAPPLAAPPGSMPINPPAATPAPPLKTPT